MKTLILAISLFVTLPGTSAAEFVTVYANNENTVSTNTVLLSGHEYLIQVQGTFIYNKWATGYVFGADAEWAFDQATGQKDWVEQWTRSGDPYAEPEYMMDLIINGQGINWMGTPDTVVTINSFFSAHTYSPSHIYRTTIIGQDLPISLMIADSPYSDNEGQLTVEINEIPEPATLSLLALGAILTERKRK
jgi:hypothetical protein